MHYYQFNIGDYQSHTSHLDDLEDLVYRRLLDWLYLHEKPLPFDVQEIAKFIRMRTECERIANVLKEFFIEGKDGYSHARVDKEITLYRGKSKKASNSAKSRWAKQRKGSQGDANALRTLCEGNAKQEPITNKQEPITNTYKDMETPEDASPVPYAKIVDLYHSVLPELRHVAKLNEARKSQVRQRWKQDLPELDEWRKYFEYVRESAFLMGQVQPSFGRKPFIADFDFLINGTNALKIAEGKYHG